MYNSAFIICKPKAIVLLKSSRACTSEHRFKEENMSSHRSVLRLTRRGLMGAAMAGALVLGAAGSAQAEKVKLTVWSWGRSGARRQSFRSGSPRYLGGVAERWQRPC